MTVLNTYIPVEILYVLASIFGILVVSAVSFFIIYRSTKSVLSKELLVRVGSWWWITAGVVVIVCAPKIFGTILIAYVSFVALREMFSIGIFRESDRTAMFFSYSAIPIQFYLAYNHFYSQFLFFIPLYLFIGVPFILVMSGKIQKIGRSMSIIPALLIQTVYMLSHLVLFFNFDLPGFKIGAGGLILFLVILTAFNDVFQYTWGKLLGKRKILPGISPNKTWAGFIGGVISTTLLAYFICFLTPLNDWQALLAGLIIGVMGFIGDALVSAIKRDLGVKDTSNLIPGHGGAMDRLDSIIITTPVFYHLLVVFFK